MQSLISLISSLSDGRFAPWLQGVWTVMLVAVILLHVAVYTIPYRLVPWNALPWAFRLDRNVDLDFQMVTYTAVHDTRFARWSHLSIPLEQVAWAVILLSCHPSLFAVVLVLVAVQAFHLGERAFAYWVVAMWAAIAALGAVAWLKFGVAAVALSKLLLLVGAAARMAGHTVEPIPPFVGERRDTFVPLGSLPFTWRLPVQALAGTVSEFAAALPHRLILVQLWWLAQRLGHRPANTRPWHEASDIGLAIRTRGWKAYPPTHRLIVTDAPAALYGVGKNV